MSDIQIIQGDCLEVMKQFDDNQFDLVLTDPPYGINFQSNSAKEQRHEVLSNDDKPFNIDPYMHGMKRVTRNTGAWYLFCRYDIAYQWQEIVCPDNQIVVARGRCSMGDLSNYSFEYECLLYVAMRHHKPDATPLKIPNNSHKPNPPKYKSRIGNLWTDVVCNEAWERSLHPTQKTVEVMEKVLALSTNEGDTVLDPFLGSGTTAVACERMGRNCVGIEISEEYCEIARKRVQEEKDKMGLFAETDQ